MHEQVPHLPVLALSDVVKREALAWASELLNLIYLKKPFRPVELIQAIEAARSGRRQVRRVSW